VRRLGRRRRLEKLVERLEGCRDEDERVAILRELRDAGALTASAFREAVGPRAPGAAADARAIRKQVVDLRSSDLERYAIWEFALDEEGEEGQDEETVKPRPDLEVADPRNGLFVVRAGLTAADGTPFAGFVTPNDDLHIRFVQPTIVTDAGHVRFWFGIVTPSRATLDESYRALGKTADELFPLRYRARVDCAGADPAGELPGFQHYEAGRTDRVVTVK